MKMPEFRLARFIVRLVSRFGYPTGL